MSFRAPEHWLTLMACTCCDQTPDKAPVYKCTSGHIVCSACFQIIAQNAVPTCRICGSDEFHRQDVSSDFLHKLQKKPGIGRTRRYEVAIPSNKSTTSHRIAEMTVEELFQLPTHRLNQLFDETTKGRNRVVRKVEMVPSVSRKPIKCPHTACGKMIAISSFKMHFKYEHVDLKRFTMTRSQEMLLSFDPSSIRLGHSSCLGIITLMAGQPSKAEVATFWIILTGSPSALLASDAFILFWLLTNDEEKMYACTMELASYADICTMTTFCKVSDVHAVKTFADVDKTMRCLFIAYGTIKNMLTYGPQMTFRVIIH